MTQYQIPALLWAGLILLVSLLPGRDMPSVHILNFDKIAHLGVYGVFVFLLLVGFRKQRDSMKLYYRAIPIAFLVAFAYGTIIEVLQGMIHDDRFFDIFDILANTAGNLSGIVGFYLIYRKI